MMKIDDILSHYCTRTYAPLVRGYTNTKYTHIIAAFEMTVTICVLMSSCRAVLTFGTPTNLSGSNQHFIDFKKNL